MILGGQRTGKKKFLFGILFYYHALFYFILPTYLPSSTTTIRGRNSSPSVCVCVYNRAELGKKCDAPHRRQSSHSVSPRCTTQA